MDKVHLLNFGISSGKLSGFLSEISRSASLHISSYTCVANVHMMIEAQFDKSFANIVNNADIVTPDGKPLCWALKLLYGIRQERIAGMDLLPVLLKIAKEENISVYFYGGTQEILSHTGLFISRYYPSLKVAGMYSPPFRKSTIREDEDIIEEINNSGAGLVFVVLGCPKQEKWMAAMKGRINAMMIGIGGALPVIIGMQKRAPHWMQKSGLEWLFRLMQEPRRLFKRYLVTNSIFLYLLLKEFIKIKLIKKKYPGFNM